MRQERKARLKYSKRLSSRRTRTLNQGYLHLCLKHDVTLLPYGFALFLQLDYKFLKGRDYVSYLLVDSIVF